MADFWQYFEYERYENGLSLVIGIALTIHGLQDYCNSKLRTIRKTISRNCSSLPKCIKNCSQEKGKWCETCAKWKSELYGFCPENFGNYIKWNKMSSKNWPSQNNEIFKVFVHYGQNVSKCTQSDLPSILSFIRNCNICRVSDGVIERVSIIRNSYYAHDCPFVIDRTTKQNSINCLLDLLNEHDIATTTSACNVRPLLEKLLHTECISHVLLEMKHNIKDLAVNVVKKKIRKKSNKSSMLERRKLIHIIQNASRMENQTSKGYKISLVLRCITVIVALLACLTRHYFDQKPSVNTHPTKCLSMRFMDHGGSDWDFDFYIEDKYNESFITRNWLASLLLVHLQATEQGVLVTGDMGTGKSTLVAEAVCAKQNTEWLSINRLILAYHVCQYDSKFTQYVHVFIRNMAYQLIKHFPAIRNTILPDESTYSLLAGHHCSKDVFGCFDRLVINPIRKNILSIGTYDLLIIVDALDECFIGNDEASIMVLLANRMHRFPNQMKFLITSRDILSIRRKFKNFRQISLHSYQENTLSDSKKFIEIKCLESGLKCSNYDIESISKLANGSFLYLDLYFKQCSTSSKTCDTKRLPSSLAEVYNRNLQRIFGANGNDFIRVKPLFEILSVTLKPFTVHELLKICEIMFEFTPIETLHYFDIKLAHFLHRSQNRYSFIHKSLKDFFLEETDILSPFHIDAVNGHKRLATYLLNDANIKSQDTGLVRIAYHVAQTNNMEIETMFLENVPSALVQRKSFIIHEASRETNSYRTVSLLLKLLHVSNRDIDEKDNTNQTPSFVAAANGNDKALECLLDHGANISFVKENETPFIPYLHYEQECEEKIFCGYNLLQIAVQNGHEGVVKLLLNRNQALLHHVNDLGISAFHLAVSKGFTKIVLIILSINSSLADWTSLHHAAKGGHNDIVDLLHEYNVSDECPLCNENHYWLPRGKIRGQSFMNIERNTQLYDDWHLIKCESALEAAIQSCYFDITKKIIHHSNKSLNCRGLHGRTPLITAVRYQCSDIFKHLLSNGAKINNTCIPYNHSTLEISYLEMVYIQLETCPHGASVFHMLGIYFSSDIAFFLLNNNLREFDAKDNFSYTPMHYAFCKGNLEYILFAKRVFSENAFHVRSQLGQTPFHLSIICNEIILFSLTKLYKIEIPDVFDNDARSLSHYLFLEELNPNTDILMKEENRYSRNETFVLKYLELFISLGHNMTRQDVSGKTFLSYALESRSVYYPVNKILKLLSSQDLLQIKKTENLQLRRNNFG